MFDLELKFDKQIKAVIKSFFSRLGLARLKPILSRKDLEKVINAFVLSLVWTIAMCCMWSPARPLFHACN